MRNILFILFLFSLPGYGQFMMVTGGGPDTQTADSDSSLLDPGKGTFDSGTESWVTAGGNPMVNDDGALKITYFDNSAGATCDLSAASDLITNLTVDAAYTIYARAKVNEGSSVELRVSGPNVNFGTVNTTDFAWYSGSFIANHATDDNFRLTNFGTDEIIWIDQWILVKSDTTVYYVSNGGNDSNTGYLGSPWETIGKVNASSFDPGDRILFDKGDTWRLVDDPGGDWDINWIGAENNNITIGAYGTGDRPRILGSDTITNWVDLGSNVWVGVKADIDTFPTGRIFFEELDDSVKWGILETSRPAGIDAPYEYYFGNDSTYIYSTSDPSSAFASVEIAQIDVVMEFQTGGDSCEYITVDGLEMAYSKNGLIKTEWPGGITGQTRQLKGLTVRNCLLHHNGYKNASDGYAILFTHSDVLIEDNEISNSGRRNISIMPDNSYTSSLLSNIIIQDNYIHNGWHTTGLDVINLHASAIVEDITFRRNIVEEDSILAIDGENPLSVMIYMDVQGAETGTIRDVNIINNLFKFPRDNAIQIDIADSVRILYNTFHGVNANTANYKAFLHMAAAGSSYYLVENNIFNAVGNAGQFYIVDNAADTPSDWNQDYNLMYHETMSNSCLQIGGVKWSLDNWATYVAAASRDDNSPTPADPAFTDPPGNLNLQTGSPAIDAGIAIEGITTDYDGVERGTPPNIGAMETVEDP